MPASPSRASARFWPNTRGWPARVVWHCFSADTAVARRVLDLGGYCSFTGVVTFKNAEIIRASARFVPRDRIMVETDAPYLSPEPVRKVRAERAGAAGAHGAVSGRSAG